MTTAEPGARKRKNKPRQLRLDSMTGVNPKHTHGIGIWGNERVVMSVRVDKKLKKAFKPASQALFGSTCNPIESWMTGIVGIYNNQKMNGVNPSITVDIGEIKIERNLRERRKVTVASDGETTIKRCTIANCVTGGNRRPGIAVASARYLPKGKEYCLCTIHFAQYRTEPKVWKILAVEPLNEKVTDQC